MEYDTMDMHLEQEFLSTKVQHSRLVHSCKHKLHLKI